MKTRDLVGIAASIVLFAACVPSVNPYYTEKDLVFDARLVGEWQSKDDSDRQRWAFEKSGDKAYKVIVTDKAEKRGEMEAHLFKLKDELFLDLMPNDCKFASDQSDIVSAAMFPGHLLMRVPQIEPALRLAYCDYDWLGKYLEAHPQDLAFHKEEKSGVLVAQTKDLQTFVTKHLSEMFQSPMELERKPAK